MARKYNLLSADSHLEIAPDRWTDRVPAKHRDRAPRRIKLANGGDGVVVENRNLYVLGLAITPARHEDARLSGVSYDTGEGAGPPERRLKEQDMDGVNGEVMFTSAGNFLFWRGIKSDEAYASVIHAYNEFLVEEYCAAAPDRLMAMGLIPITNINDAIAELEYCKKGGLKGVALGVFPSGKGLPTPEDDRFWAAALDMEMPLTIHVGFIGRTGPSFKYEKIPEDISPFGSDPVGAMGRFGGDACMPAIQMMMAGVFDRFPKMRIYTAETMVGWLPYFLDQLDDNWRRDRYWMANYFDIKSFKREKPSEYIREHCLWGFINDPYGVKVRHDIGIDKMLWASDFPHSASDWPNSHEVLDQMFANVDEEERYQITVGNAVDFFHLDNEA